VSSEKRCLRKDDVGEKKEGEKMIGKFERGEKVRKVCIDTRGGKEIREYLKNERENV